LPVRRNPTSSCGSFYLRASGSRRARGFASKSLSAARPAGSLHALLAMVSHCRDGGWRGVVGQSTLGAAQRAQAGGEWRPTAEMPRSRTPKHARPDVWHCRMWRTRTRRRSVASPAPGARFIRFDPFQKCETPNS
jgi:hypothetical protein